MCVALSYTVDPPMTGRQLSDELERWRARFERFIPGPIWLALGAASGFVAARASGREVFRISVFQHTTAASIAAAVLLTAFVLGRRRFPQFSGLCLWLSTFAIGLLSL